MGGIVVIYFDEAGNSGCLTKSGKVSYRGDDQPLYALAAVMPGYEDSDLFNHYREFKARWSPEEGEIKGSDLLTRRNNDALEDFIERFVGKCPVWLCVYSKDFYLATALMQSALGPDAKSVFPFEYYSEASDLALFGREVIDAYAEYSNNPTEEASEKLVRNLLDGGIIRKAGLFWTYLEQVASAGSLSTAFDRGIASGGYEKPAYQNLVNLSAFGELMLAIKLDGSLNNGEIKVVHDHIIEFEEEYIAAFRAVGVNIQLKFGDSSSDLGIQLADNMASIVFGAAKRVLKASKDRRQWATDNDWAFRLWSRLFLGIGPSRFKLVVPLQEQAFFYTIAEMYRDTFPEKLRNGFVFNGLYKEWLRFVCDTQLDLVAEYDAEATSSLLMR